ncbi:MAG: twin-arginine translocation signal domain-containing protein [Dehalococcoidia bacterium]
MQQTRRGFLGLLALTPVGAVLAKLVPGRAQQQGKFLPGTSDSEVSTWVPGTNTAAEPRYYEEPLRVAGLGTFARKPEGKPVHAVEFPEFKPYPVRR